MKHIKITTNTTVADNVSFQTPVSEKCYKQLQKLETAGGFRRFHIDYIADSVRTKTDYDQLSTWLQTYVFPETTNQKLNSILKQ